MRPEAGRVAVLVGDQQNGQGRMNGHGAGVTGGPVLELAALASQARSCLGLASDATSWWTIWWIKIG